jgi:biopolymer transport protein ExbD/biopolymer transport protein TolR
MAMQIQPPSGHPRRTGSRLSSDINVTPFVDVMLVLLIIFMVTAPVLQSGIEVEVPKTRTVKEITEERIVISIDRGQKIYLGNDPIIFLRSDENVPFGAVATVMDALMQSGITNVSIVTQPLNQQNERRR